MNYSLKELPSKLKRQIIEDSTKLAGWTSPKEVGEGLVMGIEWLTFVHTMKEWKRQAKYNRNVLKIKGN